MQNFSLLVHLLGKCLFDPFQGLFGPPKNQPWRTSCFLGQVCQAHMVFQVSTDNLGFLIDCPAFFLPIFREGGFSMRTSFLVRVIA